MAPLNVSLLTRQQCENTSFSIIKKNYELQLVDTNSGGYWYMLFKTYDYWDTVCQKIMNWFQVPWTIEGKTGDSLLRRSV